MRVHTKLVLEWDEEKQQYVTVYEEGYDYDGPVALCCGASSEQKESYQSQKQLAQIATETYQKEFEDAEGIFNTLSAAFTPILKAGPNQEGFSPTELASMRTSASDTTAAMYQNAKKALGENIAARGGGNEFLPSGADDQMHAGLMEAASKQEAETQNQITQADYATGRDNYFKAAAGLGGTTSVFSPTNQGGGVAVEGGSAAANTANQIAQANNAWMGAVGGVLGGLASNIAIPDLGGGKKP